MTTPLLQVDKLNAYRTMAVRILFDVSFEVGRGEVVALMGRNGSGKSTTIKAVVNMLVHKSGEIPFMGEDIRRMADASHRARGAGLCAGRSSRLRRSHGDGKSRYGSPAAARRCPRVDAREALPRIPEARRDARTPREPHERRRAGYHAHWMDNPRVVLLDEPSEGVAPVIVEQMADMDFRTKARGHRDPTVGAEPAFRRAGERPRLGAGKGTSTSRRQHARFRARRCRAA